MNFVFVVMPFTQGFARVMYPFDEEEEGSGQEPTLFVNDEVLIVAEGTSILWCKTETLQKSTMAPNADDKFFAFGKKNPQPQGMAVRYFMNSLQMQAQKVDKRRKTTTVTQKDTTENL